jgi:hypothetical protein
MHGWGDWMGLNVKRSRVRSLEKKLVYYYAIGNWWNAEHVREEAGIG